MNQNSNADLTDKARAFAQAGNFAAAEKMAREALEDTPTDGDLLYILAVSQRYQNKLDDAQASLTELKSVWPEYGRTYQEEGHIFRARNEAEKAIAAYADAVQFNPGLLASWKALAALRAASDNRAAAEHARLHVERLTALPKDLLSVTSFLAEGKLYKAEQLCRQFLQHNPHHIEAMRLLAQIGLKLNVLDDAEFLLESCLEFQPDYLLARIDYLEVLNRRQKYDQALQQAEQIRKTNPSNPTMILMHANALMSVGRYEEALRLFDDIADRTDNPEQLHMARGHALKTVGRHDEAISAYRAAYQEQPAFGDAYWSLANLKTYTFDESELAQMVDQERANGVSAQDRVHLCFALGKAYEDRGDPETSFKYYARGNDTKSRILSYDAGQMDEAFEAQKTTFTRALFERRAGLGHMAADPIFIVGMPRAGSTLLEQILASHSRVDGTLELPNILATAHRLGGRRLRGEDNRYPGIMTDLPADQLKALGEAYINDTRIHRQNAPFFIDKMPNNFRHIGLIKMILPNARIIDARRDPMACCFSGFKQLFAEGQEFSYGQSDIGRYYSGYVALMDHWETVLPGEILRVDYEHVVADLETQVRRILEFCQLDFEQDCLHFHRTDRAIRTASSEQVRQPINTGGMQQWRPFDSYLAPMKTALGLNSRDNKDV
ncbi:MAG: sulfotransferase [Maricaulis sp.]|nr:sulfotransferase [Maricaulis sp.]